jgi:hypothetical protein
MHLHTHLLDCILDYGPVYSFWLFSFERYNGILGEYCTNQRSVEIQLIRKFTSNQMIKDIPFPNTFKEIFQPIIDRLIPKQAGSLQDQASVEIDTTPGVVISSSLLSIGPLRRNAWICNEALYTCCAPFHRDCLDVEYLPYLKKTYKAMFDDLDESTITRNFQRYSSCKFDVEKYGSINTRGERSSYVLARWCGLGGKIESRGTDLRPGIIKYFMKQNIKVNGQYVSCVLAAVLWFQVHPERHSLGSPVEVWCKDLFEIDGPASFIPVQRIHGKFVPAFDNINNENVLIVCPLPRKIQV